MDDIKQLRMRKPSWATDPEPIDFKVLNEPLEKLVKRTINTLERKARADFSKFDFLAEKILVGCYQTYKAIRKLVAKDPKYPTQAHTLNRSLLDSILKKNRGQVFILDIYCPISYKDPTDLQ